MLTKAHQHVSHSSLAYMLILVQNIYLKVLLIYYKIDTTICTQKTRLPELFTCENIQSTYVNSAHNYFC